MITYYSGADGHYISKKDRETAGLPILRPSTKRVMVANGEKSKGQHVTRLIFPLLSSKAQQAHTFKEFPTSLMSIGNIANDSRYQFSPKMKSKFITKKMSSSNVKTNHFSLEYVTNTEAIAFH